MQNTVHDTFICKTFMRWLALIIFRISGWKVSGERPRIPKYVIIAAPHTSNWDFVYTICLAFILEIDPMIMMKHTWFRWPMGGFCAGWGPFLLTARDCTMWLRRPFKPSIKMNGWLWWFLLPEPARKSRTGSPDFTILPKAQVFRSCLGIWIINRRWGAWDRRYT